MSLDFNLLNVRPDLATDSKERQEWFNRQWDNGKLESAIFNTMFLGINNLKDEATARKFYARYVAYNTACGYKELFLDLDFILSIIGLSTNASTITDAAFNKKCITSLNAYAATKAGL